MRAGAIAVQAGLANANGRWCHVNFLNFESTAAAVVAQIKGLAPNISPMLTNTCYSFVSPTEVVHVASVHAYDAAEKTFKTVAGSGGVSSARNEQEAGYAMAWARNMWPDTFG